MTDKRYQVFLSSTFRDLVAERQAVLLAIQRLNHIPAGMELFPSANHAPWDVIERIISNSDYYVVIIGGRYGSTDENGISFTEREYELAVASSIPVLPFLHDDPDSLPMNQCEIAPEARARLAGLTARIRNAHHCNFWKTPQELAASVVVSLVNEIASNPRTGWIRERFENDREELLTSLERVRRRNDELVREIEQLKAERVIGRDDLAFENDAVEVHVGANPEGAAVNSATVTWHEVFQAIGYMATSGASEDDVSSILADAFLGPLKDEGYVRVSKETTQRIRNQLIALGLLDVESQAYAKPGSGGAATFTRPVWKLTDRGKRLFALSQAARRSASLPEGRAKK
jgi:hypothetical protein